RQRGGGHGGGHGGGRSGDGGGRSGDGGAPRSGPRERSVYGVGPVRGGVARRPQSVEGLWGDPQRAGQRAGGPGAAVVQLARAAGIRVEDRDRQTLDGAAGEGGRHQGIIAWLGAFGYADVDDMIPTDEPALLVALDGVEDPRNLGAILRSAYLLGAHGVIIPEHRAAAVTSVVAKASAGASELVPIAQVGNLVRARDQLRELNVWRGAVH